MYAISLSEQRADKTLTRLDAELFVKDIEQAAQDLQRGGVVNHGNPRNYEDRLADVMRSVGILLNAARRELVKIVAKDKEGTLESSDLEEFRTRCKQIISDIHGYSANPLVRNGFA